jgi:hypothetical protein
MTAPTSTMRISTSLCIDRYSHEHEGFQGFSTGLRAEPFAPGLAGGTALGRCQEVLERDVNERHPGLGERLVGVADLAAHVDAPALRLLDAGANDQRAVDRHRPPIVEKHAAGDRREAVPGRDQAARLVEQGGDEAAVDEARRALVALVERESRLVAVGALPVGLRQVEADRVVTAAEAGRLVVGRDLQRRPPRSKCALKKFSEPDVAIEAEAEISSASVAAATIWAKR